MGRRSTLLDLPDEVLSKVHRLIADGVTIDEIKTALDRAGHPEISRSAVGRYKMNQEVLSSELKHSRMIAETLVREGDTSDSHMARVGIEMLQGVMMKIVASEISEGGIELDAKEAHFLARAFKDLSAAQSIDDARISKIKAEERARILREATTAAKEIGTQHGLSKEAQAEFRKRLLKINV